MHTRAPQLVIGIGNLLRSDDGAGVEVVQRLLRLNLPPEVEICDGGTLGTELSSVIEQRRRVVVIDAIDAGDPPGTVHRLKPEDVQATTGSGLSVHDFHLLHALDETRLLERAPDQVVILAVQVGSVAAGIGLTPPVREAVDQLIQLALNELGISQDQLTNATAGTQSDQSDAALDRAAATEVMQ